METDVEAIENAFEWESFQDGKPYLGTYRQEIPNRVKMLTRKLDLKDWVKIDQTYASQQKEKERLIETLRDKVFVTNQDKSTKLAKRELLETLIQYLPERFPDKFESRKNGVYNKMLQEYISSSDGPNEEDPLIKCGRLTQEDWCVMEWSNEHEAYCLTAGVVFFPSGWSLKEKWNLPMIEIHQPVNAFTKHLKPLVYSLFKTMSPDTPFCRGNWSIFNDLKSPLDLYAPEAHRASSVSAHSYNGAKTGRELIFRCEYQTLRKLPKSKAIIFSIRTYQIYLEEFQKFSKEDTETLINAIKNFHPDFIGYKRQKIWKNAALKYLTQNVLGEKHWFWNSWCPGLVLVFGGAVLAIAVAWISAID